MGRAQAHASQSERRCTEGAEPAAGALAPLGRWGEGRAGLGGFIPSSNPSRAAGHPLGSSSTLWPRRQELIPRVGVASWQPPGGGRCRPVLLPRQLSLLDLLLPVGLFPVLQEC